MILPLKKKLLEISFPWVKCQCVSTVLCQSRIYSRINTWGICIPAYYILVSGSSGIFVSSGAFLIRLYFNIEIRGKVKAALSVFAISHVSFKDWNIGGGSDSPYSGALYLQGEQSDLLCSPIAYL